TAARWGKKHIGPGMSAPPPGAPRPPLAPPAIPQFLGPGNWLISKVRVSSLDRAGDAIDLVVATVNAPAGIVEHAIFGEYLVDGRAPTPGSFSPKTSCRLRVSKVEMLDDMACLRGCFPVLNANFCLSSQLHHR